ncbi:MAG: BrnA antitoxin family protein [Candidatus Levybacteria bacterium]|nr:BrnA antitoxin family protein [Candidatus Levybacteria bacterium]
MKKKLNIPKFKDENQESKFWAKLDLSKHFEPSDFERVSFPNLKPTTRPISIRIPEFLLNRIKEKANELNIPYQSLIKEILGRSIFKKSY